MAAKLILITALLVLSNKGRVLASFVAAPQVVAPGPPVLAPAPAVITDTYDPNPAYSFAYDVQDALTGDSKGQVESRANGAVRGQYNVADPDGTRRIVDYYADPVHGFNAVVRKVPLGVVAKPVVPVARALPVAAPVVPAPLPAVPAPFPAYPAAPYLSRAVLPAPLPAVPAPLPAYPAAPYLSRAVLPAAPAPAFLPAPGPAFLPAPARFASPYIAAPPLAPALGRFASPYLGAPAPLGVAPGGLAVF